MQVHIRSVGTMLPGPPVDTPTLAKRFNLPAVWEQWVDTFIGTQDGVPFSIPGQRRLLTKPQAFPEKQVPDYIQALERPDLTDPGTVAHVGLKGLRLPGVTRPPASPQPEASS